MKKNVLMGTMLLLAGSLLAADADKDSVKSGAKKLMDSGYTWKQNSENAGGNGGGGRGGFGGPQEGKAGKDGTFSISMTFGQNTRETIVKGDKSVSKNADGEWQTPEEARAAAAANGNGGGRRGGRGNAFQNFKGPAAQIEALVDAAKDLSMSEGVIAGDFTEDGAKKFMMGGGGRGGRRGGNANPPEISGAKGSVKFWVKDGAVTKVVYHVTGTISFNGNDRDVDRTTTIEFKDIGSTTVTIPEEAAKKLS